MQNRKPSENILEENTSNTNTLSVKPEENKSSVTPKPEQRSVNYTDLAMVGTNTLCLIMLAMDLNDGSISSYIKMASYLTGTGLAINKVGFEKTKQMVSDTLASVSSNASSLFNYAKSFAPKSIQPEIGKVLNRKRM